MCGVAWLRRRAIPLHQRLSADSVHCVTPHEFAAFANLVLFSISISLMVGDATSEGADCGYGGGGLTVSGGAAFGLAIVAFVFALIQAWLFRGAAATAYEPV